MSRKKILTSVVLFFFGFGAGVLTMHYFVGKKESPHRSIGFTMRSDNQSGSKLTSPLLDCEINEEGALQMGIVPFEDELSEEARTLRSAKKVSNIAIYYRDLSNGPWFGVGENDGFLPASLLKVPLMIAYFKASESDPLLLSKKVLFDKVAPNPLRGSQTIHPSQEIQVNTEYSVEELIERMIRFSDNQATQLLYENIDGKYVFDVYRRIGVDSGSIEYEGAQLGPREYSAFFRVLHNASYLNRELSEKALELLAATEHTQGLVAGVPQSTVVAHKFGEAGSTEEKLQYHDCGIVYHPKRHYILCVMTSGEDQNRLIESIQHISQFVWNKVDEQTR